MFTQDENQGKLAKKVAELDKKVTKLQKKKDDTNSQATEQDSFPSQNFPNPEKVYVMTMPSGNAQGPSFNFRGRGGYNPNYRGNNRGGYQNNRGGRGGYNGYRQQGGRGQEQPNWRQNNSGGNRGGFRGSNRGGRGRGDRAPYNPNVTCHYCTRVGHIQRDCFTYKKDMQNNGPANTQNNPQVQQQNNNQQRNNSTNGRANLFMTFMDQFQDYVQQNTQEENS